MPLRFNTLRILGLLCCASLACAPAPPYSRTTPSSTGLGGDSLPGSGGEFDAGASGGVGPGAAGGNGAVASGGLGGGGSSSVGTGSGGLASGGTASSGGAGGAGGGGGRPNGGAGGGAAAGRGGFGGRIGSGGLASGGGGGGGTTSGTGGVVPGSGGSGGTAGAAGGRIGSGGLAGGGIGGLAGGGVGGVAAGGAGGRGGGGGDAGPVILSIDFVGGGMPMTPTESAGVVPARNWNSATGAMGSATSLILSDGTLTSASATWNAPGDGPTPGVWRLAYTDAPGNVRMMNGYLDPGSQATITVSNLPAAITADGYDVYVYTYGDVPPNEARTYGYAIGATSLTVTQTGPDPNSFPGFTLAPEHGPGTYVIFRKVTGAAFTLKATPIVVNRAPINGLQIVWPAKP